MRAKTLTGMAIMATTTAALMGCAGVSSMQLTSNEYLVSVDAAPVCGRAGAQRLAMQQAAIDTIKNGYDKFRVVGAHGGSRSFVAGYTPRHTTASHTGTLQANPCIGGYCTGTYSGQTNAVTRGGAPITMRRHNQDITVKMYNYDQPGSRTAIDARKKLGRNWRRLVKNPPKTCA